MSSKERTRMVVLEQLKHREISVSDAVRRLGITRRHVFRLMARYRAGGPGAIVHRARDRRPGNRRLDEALRRHVIELYREHYPDFGPTLAAEKMAGIGISGISGTCTFIIWNIGDVHQPCLKVMIG